MDEQGVSGTCCLVCCARVCVIEAKWSRVARDDATGAAVDRLSLYARMVGKRVLGCA